jgi:hypothetical protein
MMVVAVVMMMMTILTTLMTTSKMIRQDRNYNKTLLRLRFTFDAK